MSHTLIEEMKSPSSFPLEMDRQYEYPNISQIVNNLSKPDKKILLFEIVNLDSVLRIKYENITKSLDQVQSENDLDKMLIEERINHKREQFSSHRFIYPNSLNSDIFRSNLFQVQKMPHYLEWKMNKGLQYNDIFIEYLKIKLDEGKKGIVVPEMKCINHFFNFFYYDKITIDINVIDEMFLDHLSLLLYQLSYGGNVATELLNSSKHLNNNMFLIDTLSYFINFFYNSLTPDEYLFKKLDSSHFNTELQKIFNKRHHQLQQQINQSSHISSHHFLKPNHSQQKNHKLIYLELKKDLQDKEKQYIHSFSKEKQICFYINENNLSYDNILFIQNHLKKLISSNQAYFMWRKNLEQTIQYPGYSTVKQLKMNEGMSKNDLFVYMLDKGE